ncbi:hypothetical protein [Pseudomonas luteola]|uniref:hypothetical protein n=1 Tax=Pseudomonas luteola TaxID=47886 RepID=UPI000FA293A2|nr:hypothetical protein [Pseudomonas luteola]RRW51265.1 hypothetical protein EGJ50_01185 [Pseudomonas luteola]
MAVLKQSQALPDVFGLFLVGRALRPRNKAFSRIFMPRLFEPFLLTAFGARSIIHHCHAQKGNPGIHPGRQVTARVS